jgi:ABC-type transport system involved in multi-copper enzyme maturation permease subunit
VLVGPVFTRELVTLPRRSRLYVARAATAAALLVLLSTAWQVLAGMQIVRNVGDFARFGTLAFRILAPLEAAAALFFAAMTAAAAVAQEKDRRTFDLLLLTNLNNSELVLGKLGASLLGVVNGVLAATPVLALTALMGGVEVRQVAGVFLATMAGLAAAGSVGSTLALWRERTYQTLALTGLVIVAWIGLGELVAGGAELFGAGAAGNGWAGRSTGFWAATISPWHAVLAALRPATDAPWFGLDAGVAASVVSSLGVAAAANAIAVWRVRVWNPSREIMARQVAPDGAEGPAAEEAAAPHAWSLSAVRSSEKSLAPEGTAVAARGLRRSRVVGDNPILWRETSTWAYGRKVLLIRGVFLALCLPALVVVYQEGRRPGNPTTVALASIGIIGALLLNLQAVTSVTSERDARALDLLLVTDLTPQEFVFGKLLGSLYNSKEMLVMPLLLAAAAWWRGGVGGETAVLLGIGWLVVAVFALMLGLHVGMNYDVSRTAVGVSLATVFFLIVGIGVSMRIMTAFSGSFQAQLQPFLATIVGGGVGLYAALALRNPSPAITLASFALPLATFYAITSYLLEASLASFLAVAGAYGFATAAMLIPAIYEFDIVAGRTTGEGDAA